MTVRKRDGSIEPFDTAKIVRAIRKAEKSTKTQSIDDASMEKLVKFVIAKISKLDEPIEIEDIQDAVEDSLMKHNFYDIERTFRDYRVEHDKIRFKSFRINQEMEEKLAATNVQNSNANMDEASFGGRKGEMINSYLKNEALDYRISPKFSKLHENNHIYEHDLDSWSLGLHNCLSIPFDDLLSSKVQTRQTDIRKAGSVSSALQLVAVYFQLQSLQQFGGVAATHLDTTLVPYVRKSFMKHFKDGLKYVEEKNDVEITNIVNEVVGSTVVLDDIDSKKSRIVEDISINDKAYKKYAKAWRFAIDMTKKECEQGVEALLHNLNSLQSRSGNQLPFSSINYGLETSDEGRMIVTAILNNTIRGVGNGATSIFPCQIFQLKDGVNTKEGEPNYDLFQLALKSTAKRMYPNYVNCDWSVQQEGFKKSQDIKARALKALETDGDVLKKIAKLPRAVQETLGFHIEDDGSDEVTIE